MNRFRLTMLFSIAAAVSAIVATTLLWLSHLYDHNLQDAYRNQQIQMRVFRTLIDRLGPVEVRDGVLYAGDTRLNGNDEVTAHMKMIYGGTATIFCGDVRVATNILKPDGASAEGSRLKGVAYDHLVHRAEPYQGETDLFGVPHLVRYEALNDLRGQRVGALSVGMPKVEFLRSYHEVRNHVLLLSGVVMTGFTLLIVAVILVGRRMENSIVESEELYRTVFETTGCATVTVEPDTIIGMANSEFLRFAGLPREEVEGKMTFGDFVRAPDREKMREYHRRRREGDLAVPKSYDFTFYGSDGTPREMTCTVNMVPGTSRSILSCIDITERKRMERELRFTQLSVDVAGSCIYRIAADGTFLRVNDEAVRTLGYSHEEFSAMTVMDIGPTFPHEVWEKHWRDLKREGSVILETLHRAKDGRTFPVEVTANYVEFEGVGYNFAFSRDISERKRMEQALRESEELFRHVFERSAVGIAVVDLTGRIIVANASLASILGRTPAELPGTAWQTLTPLEDMESETEVVRSLAGASCNYVVYDKRYVRPDTGIIWARVTLSVVKDEAGEAAHYVAMVEDNTQRRLAFEELREKSEQIRLIADNAPSLIAYVDTDFRYRFVNLRYEDWFGRRRGKIVGRLVSEIQAPEVYGQVYPYMLRALAGEKVSFCMVVRNAAGELRHMDVNYIPDFVEAGVAGIVIQVHDITNLKRAEAMLEAEREVLALIAAGAPLAQTLEVLCRRVEELSGDGLCSVLLVDEEGERLRHCAAPSLPPEYSAAIDGTRIGPRVGSCGTAAYRKEQVIVTDIANDPLWDGFTKLPLRHGLRACWSKPIVATEGDVYGTFAMYYRAPHAPSAFELNLIDHAGEVARIAIERHRASEALAVVRRRLQAILDTIPDLVWVKDRESRFVMVNASFGRSCGLAPQEVVGKTDCDVWPADLAEAYRQDDVRVMISGRARVIEEQIEERSGVRTWIETVKMPFRDDSGEVVGTTGIARNIDDRKRAEEALRKSEEKFATAFHTCPDSVSLSRLDNGEFVEINPGFLTVFGYTPAEALGKTSVELGLWPDPADRQKLVRPLEECGEALGLEIRFRRKDGTLITTLMSARTFESEGVRYLIGLVRDISDRKLAEQALRESEERFRELFRQNADAIVLFRYSTFDIIDINPRVEEMFGYPVEQLARTGHWQLLDPAEAGRFTRAVATLGMLGEFRLDRVGAICHDGSRISVSVWAKLITMGNDQVVYCSIRDITEKVRLESEMKETQAKLIQTNKMTSLGMLVSGIAHEINNPNNFIGINSSILADIWRDARPVLQRVHGEEGLTLAGVPYPEMEAMVPRLLDGLAKGSERIAAIVRNLKDFARDDVGITATRIDIRKVIDDALLILTHQTHKYTERLTVEVPEGLPWGRGNPQQIEQVVINLVMNALQALPDRSAGITITARHDMEENLVILTVCDEGRGMSQEVLERATEPFFSTRLSEGGTGLGLSISASIIREHGGTLTFASEPGTGTTATVVLPVVADRVPALAGVQGGTL